MLDHVTCGGVVRRGQWNAVERNPTMFMNEGMQFYLTQLTFVAVVKDRDNATSLSRFLGLWRIDRHLSQVSYSHIQDLRDCCLVHRLFEMFGMTHVKVG